MEAAYVVGAVVAALLIGLVFGIRGSLRRSWALAERYKSASDQEKGELDEERARIGVRLEPPWDKVVLAALIFLVVWEVVGI